MSYKNFPLLAVYCAFVIILIGCKANNSETSFSSDGKWVLDVDGMSKRSPVNFPEPPFTPIYMTCEGNTCMHYAGVPLKLSREGNEIKLTGRDSSDYNVHLPVVNFAKFPDLEFRFRILDGNTIQQMSTDGIKHFTLKRYADK